MSMLSLFAHHGINYVPLGFSHTYHLQSNLKEVHGGSAWGAGTFASSDGSRQPTELELETANIQGKVFYETLAKVKF